MNNSDDLLRYILCYGMMFLFTWIGKLNRSNRLFDAKGFLAANRTYLVGLHLAGILWLGIVPLTYLNQIQQGILFGNGIHRFLWWLLFGCLLLAMSVTGFRASRRINISEQNNPASLNKFLAFYFPVRILFLCAYESFFRGFLLFGCIKWFGIIPAVALSTGLTVLIHVFTNKKEMWACIPFGIILCTCCITIHAVWPAMLLHLALSLAYEIPIANKFFTQLKPVK